MKRLMMAILVVIWMTTSVFAAGTVTVTGPTKIHGGSSSMYSVVFACTADAADGSIPDTEITAATLYKLTGYWLSHIKVEPGATGPTDDSDLYIKVGGTDILGGNGVNIVDNATNGYCVPYGSNGDAQYPMSGENLTLDIDNNAVNSAIVTVTLIFDK